MTPVRLGGGCVFYELFYELFVFAYVFLCTLMYVLCLHSRHIFA